MGDVVKGKVGQPTLYSVDIADEICNRLIEGEALSTICNQDNFPKQATIYDWVKNDFRGFQKQYLLAREFQSHHFAEQILELSRDDNRDVANSKLEIDQLKWYAGKMNKQYSDRHQLDIGGQEDNPAPVFEIKFAKERDYDTDE